MTEEEQNVYLVYFFSGAYDRSNNTIMMGSDAFERLEKYEQEMIDKYIHLVKEKPKKKIVPKPKSEQTWKKKWKRNN